MHPKEMLLKNLLGRNAFKTNKHSSFRLGNTQKCQKESGEIL